ncbi:MAG: hypothetical protein HUU21_29685 [Polyangiaceae bacterium]|nr:hypothetical protein [Polyangiaceae bacterium]
MAALSLLLAGIVPAEAQAGEMRVLVVSTGSIDPVTAHLTSELISMGITVEVTPALTGDLAEIARARGARAALEVLPSQRGVRLWVPNDAPASASPRLIERQDGDSAEPAPALALRAVELLRARLVALDLPAKTPDSDATEASSPAPPPPPSTPAPTAPAAPSTTSSASTTVIIADSPPSRSTRVLTLHISPAIIAHPDSGLSLGGAAIGGARLTLSSRFCADLLVLAPVVPATLTAPSGRVRISATSIGLGGWIDLLDRGLPIAAGIGAGLAASFMGYDAEATTRNVVGQDGTVAFALPYSRLAFAWHALPPVGIRADALVGIAAPRPVIRVEGQTSDAVFGRPLLALGLGIQVSIP